MDAAGAVAAAGLGGFLVAGALLIWTDVQEHRLPNRIVLPALAGMILVVAVHASVTGDPSSLLRALAGGLLLAGFYLALRAADPAGMGGGDVKLAAVIGVFLGWHGWAALAAGAAAAFLGGAAWALLLLAAGRIDRETPIPFGPWMIVGAWAGLFAL
jgi:leader peptidase (prepilin peptidase)/N-methyltransferase